MKPWLFVGAKVVCVKFGELQRLPGEGTVKKGVVYTISAVAMFPHWDEPGVTLTEVAMPRNIWYYASAFRPVSTVNTDSQVSALRELMQKACDEKRVTVET